MKRKVIALMGAIVCFLLVINVYVSMSGSESLMTFTGLFENIQNINSIDASLIANTVLSKVTISDTGIGGLDVVIHFINGLSEILGIVTYFGVMIYNSAVYIIALFKTAFIGVI